MKDTMRQVNIEITEKKTGTVHPGIYGGFVEFIRDCVNPGIYAQVLADRSFETPGEKSALLKHWECRQKRDTCVFQLEEREAGLGKCLKIKVLDHFGGYAEVKQRERVLLSGQNYWFTLSSKTSKEFQGSYYVKIKTECETIRLELKPGEVWAEQKVAFSVKQDGKAEVSIIAEGTGCVWLDECSIVPAETVDGVWKEIVQSTKELKCGILRFPGGCFADVYDWRDGIGKNRKFQENLHWGGMEDYHFGTDEFMQFCKNTACEPMICINFGSGTPELAAAWVEYCNGDETSIYGNMRIQNGHPEPYQVHYWEIGNENYGDWEVGNCTAAEFCQKYELFCAAMKKADPSIEIIACGTNEYDASMEWNEMLMNLGTKPDLLALHFYSPQSRLQIPEGDDIYYGTVGGSVKFERILKKAADQMRQAGSFPRLAVSEWNAMYINESCREQTMEAAIFNAGLLISFLRNSDVVEIVNFSDLVNGWEGACIVNDYGKIYRTPSYYAIKLFSESECREVLETFTESERYWVKKVGHLENLDVPYVDAVAGSSQGKLHLFAVNRDRKRSARLNVKGISAGKKRIHRFIAGKPEDVNEYQNETIVIEEKDAAAEELILKPCSINRFTFY